MRELKEKEILANQFDDCVNVFLGSESTTIGCKLGLWSVTGSNKEIKRITNEAMSYWHQYKEDGEYSSIIGGKTVVEMLTSN